MNVIGPYEAFVSWGVFWTTYWVFGGILTYFFKEKRKITNLGKVISNLLVNMVWSLFGSLILSQLPLRMLTNSYLVTKFLVVYLIADIWFYHMHIMLHQGQLYHLHKRHHEFSEPFALTGLYSDIYECIFLNTLAGGLGPVIVQLPPPYIYIWLAIISWNVLIAHSGSSMIHDYHHSKFKYNYGISFIFDKLYGTWYIEPEKRDINLGNFKIDMASLADLHIR
ncbi:unnamed protein product [marine sediment metagenome]|uniref:Fatty acid hydroxylase domain-containing protein n=1 Tax=marine sediment metagenome TaxID=412755 RepID=X0YVY2_9ZZZZ